MLVSRVIPYSVKAALEKSAWVESARAHMLARTSKRLDICAAQFAHQLHMSGRPSLEGKTCLEVGAGWVLTHALVCYLLGASKVVATDPVPHARPGAINVAVKKAVVSLVRNVLAPFSEHARIRSRMDNVLAIPEFTFDALKGLGIEYVSPIDLAQRRLPMDFDFIYSHSVLEHVPREDISPMLANLGGMMSPDGIMVHAIHLVDHRDMTRHPFEFLKIPAASYPSRDQTARGNRIRCSEWEEFFGEIEGTTSEPVYIYHRRDLPLPKKIDPSVSYTDEEDLRASHVGILTRRR